MLTPHHLRVSLLQHAIQGKLVPQDPADEPASVLLQRVEAERKSLIRQGQIKKNKPTSLIFRRDGHFYEVTDSKDEKCIDDQIPFDIPDSWEWCRLGNLCVKLLTGGNYPEHISKLPTKQYSVPIFSNAEKNLGLYGYTDVAKVTMPCITVSARGTIGFSCVRRYPFVPIISLIVIIPFHEILLEYLQCVLQAKREVGVGSGTPQLTLTMLAPKLIPLPPVQEQHRIVEKLENVLPHVDRYAHVYQRYSSTLSQAPAKLRKSLLQAAIQGKLVPQDSNDEPASVLLKRIEAERAKLGKKGGKPASRIVRRDGKTYEIFPNGIERDISEEVPFSLPSSWAISRLGNLMSLVSGVVYSKSDIRNDGIRILRGGNLSPTGEIVFSPDDVFLPPKYADQRNQVQRGDIVIVASTGSKTVIGKPAFVQTELPNTQIGGFLRIVRPINDFFQCLLWVVFRSNYYRDYISSMVCGTNINNIKAEYLEMLLIPIPPLQEQYRIVEKLETLLKLVGDTK